MIIVFVGFFANYLEVAAIRVFTQPQIIGEKINIRKQMS